MLNRSYRAGLVLAAVIAGAAAAQEPAADKTPPPQEQSADQPDSGGAKPAPRAGAKAAKPGDKDAAAAPAPPPQSILPPLPDGDTVYMVTGTVMTGVQVLRSTPRFYEVEMIEGQPPLQIPRRQVKEVKYDDIDPARDRLRKAMFPGEEEVTIASGERVTGALRDKLMAPVSAEPLSYKGEDLVTVLEKIKEKTGVKLRIDPSIEEKPGGQRRWSVEVTTDKSLMVLLREDLVAAFDYVEVVFESDSIVVMTKEAAKARGAEAPDAAVAEPPADAAAVPSTPEAPAPSLPPGFPGQKKTPEAGTP